MNNGSGWFLRRAFGVKEGQDLLFGPLLEVHPSELCPLELPNLRTRREKVPVGLGGDRTHVCARV